VNKIKDSKKRSFHELAVLHRSRMHAASSKFLAGFPDTQGNIGNTLLQTNEGKIKST